MHIILKDREIHLIIWMTRIHLISLVSILEHIIHVYHTVGSKYVGFIYIAPKRGGMIVMSLVNKENGHFVAHLH